MSIIDDDVALARVKQKAKAAIEKAVALLDKEASPAIRRQVMQLLAEALFAGQRLAEWRDRRTAIDVAAAYIEAASASDDEALADDMPF